MIVLNAQSQPLSAEVITRLVRSRLPDQAITANPHDRIYHLSVVAGRDDEWPLALASLDLCASRPLVLIPPAEAQLTINLAAELYRLTGEFPVIARLSDRV